MQIKEFVLQSRASLSALYPSTEANALVNIVCQEYFGVRNYTHIINPSLELNPDQLKKAQSALSRLRKSEPVQYILGYCDFFGHRFNVNDSVLIPRPETENLCQAALEFAQRLQRTRSAYGKNARPVRILDLCTGSGCIAWTMALNIPDSIVVGVDISSKALDVARSQNFSGQKCIPPRFVQADILDDAALDTALKETADNGISGFDLILSNPPYIMNSERPLMRANVLDYEPSEALFVPDDACMRFNAKIAEICSARLYTDSMGIIEINEALGGPVLQFFRQKGFKNVRILQDTFGKNRFVSYQK